MHFKKVSHAFVLRALGNGFAVINTFLLVRLLATDEYGMFRLLNSLVIVVFEFSNLGLLQTLTRVAIDQFDRKNRGFLKSYLPIIRYIWLYQFLLTVLFVFLYMFFRAPEGIHENIFIFLAYIVVCGIGYFWSHYWIHLLYATRRILHWFSFLALLNGLKFLGIVTLTWGFSMGFEGALFAHLTAFLLGSLYSYYFWKKSLKRLKVTTHKETAVPFSVRFHMLYGVAHFINVEIHHFTGEFIVLFLNFVRYKPDIVGFTGLAASLLYMFLNFVVVLANYFFPNLPQLNSKENIGSLKKVLKLQVQGSTLVSWVMLTGFFLAAPWFFQAFLSDYLEAARLFSAFFIVVALKPFEYEFVNLTLTKKKNWLLVVKSAGHFVLMAIGLVIFQAAGVLTPLRALFLAGISDLVSLGIVFILGKAPLSYNFWRKEYIFHLFAALVLFYSYEQPVPVRIIVASAVMVVQIFINRGFFFYIISRYSERQK